MLVVLGFPKYWMGFLEHARQTPSLTGFRLPRIDELAKLARTLPGILAAGLVWIWIRPLKPAKPVAEPDQHQGLFSFPSPLLSNLVFTSALVPTALLAVAAMVFITPNSVSFAAYLQPLIVAGVLALAGVSLSRILKFAVASIFVGLALFGAIRMIGLATWGVACARDCGYSTSIEVVKGRLDSLPPDTTVVASAAYLYEVSRHDNVNAIHCDWLGQAGRDQDRIDWEGLINLRPSLLILTQFDYYRRYQPLLERLRSREGLARFTVHNHAGVTPPDAIPPLRRVVQHLSWAPVVVEMTWSTSSGRGRGKSSPRLRTGRLLAHEEHQNPANQAERRHEIEIVSPALIEQLTKEIARQAASEVLEGIDYTQGESCHFATADIHRGR